MLNTSPFATTIICHKTGVLKYFMFSASMKSLISFIQLMRKPWAQIRDQKKKKNWN